MATEYLISIRRPNSAPTLFNVYPSREQAVEALASPSGGITYYRTEPNTVLEVMSWGEYFKMERNFWLTAPPREIDEDAWDEALNCLPPMQWERVDGVERFLMSEFTTGSFTSQYAKYRSRYFTKTVDVRSEETWISAEMLAPFFS